MSPSDSPTPSQSEPASGGPLTVDAPDSISSYFLRSPDDWTEADIDRMIEHLRVLRKDLGPDQKPKAKAAAAKEKAQSIDLSALGLLGKKL